MSLNKGNSLDESKKINLIQSSSLLNLKVEILKKKQKLTKAKPDFCNKNNDYEKIDLKNVSNSKWNQKAVYLGQKIRDSLNKKKEKINNEEEVRQEDLELEKELKKSRENLEKKAKLYEEKLKKKFDSLTKDQNKISCNDEEEVGEDQDEESCLVDFEKKIISQPIEQIKKCIENKIEDTDEYVEYIDSFGRTRKCLKKDLNLYQDFAKNELLRRNLDTKYIRKPNNCYENFVKYKNTSSDSDEDKNNKTEKYDKNSHYQKISLNEVWEHGTSYYQFSLDEEERKKQMDSLEDLRKQTIKQREKADYLRIKRNQSIKERLIKIAKRKGLVDEHENDEEIFSKLKIDQYLEKESIIDNKEESNINIIYENDVKNKKIREWDLGKEDLNESCEIIEKEEPKRLKTIMSHKSYLSKKREERNNEFAPPSFYDKKESCHKSNNRKVKFTNQLNDNQLSDKIDDFLNKII